MPIGSNISVDLPIPGDTYADITAKLKAAIEVLVELLEAPIDSGALDLTTALSLHGAPLINVGGLRLVGGESTEIGTFYIDGAGEVHAVTTLGDVQITLNGNLNVAALGTIGGDYGGANPATVTFDDASGEYRFKQDTAVWASVVAADFIAKNPTSGSVAFGVDPAITTAKTFTVKSLPASGVSGLAYVAADGTVVDTNQTRETLLHKFTSIDITGKVYHGEESVVLPLLNYKQPGGSAAITTNFNFGGSDNVALVLPTGSNLAFFFLDANIPIGARLKSIKLTGSAAGSGQLVTVYIQRYDNSTSQTVTATGGFHTIGSKTFTLDTPHEMASDEIIVVVVNSATGGDLSLTNATVVFDRIAP